MIDLSSFGTRPALLQRMLAVLTALEREATARGLADVVAEVAKTKEALASMLRREMN